MTLSPLVEKILSSGAAAFFGAFAAVLVSWLTGVAKRFYDRRRANHRALINLEYTSNQHLNYLSTQLFEIKSIKEAVAKSRNEGSIPLPGNRMEPIPIPNDLVRGLTHIDLINDLFEYVEELQKLNGSISTLNRQYDIFSNALLAGTIHPKVYLHNFNVYLCKLDELMPFITDLEEKAKRLCAASRVLARTSAPRLDRLMVRFLKRKHGADFKAEVDAELKTLEEEIREIRDRSKERIKQLTESAPS
jgi:hypothetical protein